MQAASNPSRSPVFRLIAIASAGMGSFVLGLWALKLGMGGDAASVSGQAIGIITASLCALTAAGAVFSFFAGVDESVGYVVQETHFDKLTGLFARAAMVGRIAEAATRTLKDGKPVFLIDIEIDRFQHINESIGQVHGDEIIRALSSRLVAVLPKDIEIGRLGPGEFAILYPDHEGLTSIDDVAERLIAHVMQPVQVSTHLQAISLSMGIVAMPKDGVDPILLMRRANLALQHARARGIGSWATFQPEMGRVADHRQWVESELHTAYERGDFHLHYQPELDLKSHRIVGYEALIRWNHPERGLIAPMEFVPIAEETGMIVPIGEWVLRKACTDARLLPDDCFVAVNISPVQFMTKDFVGMVRNVVRETGIKPGRLELEVTETAMMQDRERAAVILKELSEMGISVAVDDFGTGYSNLAYLIDFSFKKLKIDRAFVSRMETDSSSGAVVSTIVGLSRALGVRTIAEGVETETQATLLRAAGCEAVQGYLFGRPEPLKIHPGAPIAVNQPAVQRAASLH